MTTHSAPCWCKFEDDFECPFYKIVYREGESDSLIEKLRSIALKPCNSECSALEEFQLAQEMEHALEQEKQLRYEQEYEDMIAEQNLYYESTRF